MSRTDRVPTSVLQDAFRRSGMSPVQLALTLGWQKSAAPSQARRDGTCRKEAASDRVTRALGLRPEDRGHGYGPKCRQTTSYERAVMMVRAMGFDPVDFDL